MNDFFLVILCSESLTFMSVITSLSRGDLRETGLAECAAHSCMEIATRIYVEQAVCARGRVRLQPRSPRKETPCDFFLEKMNKRRRQRPLGEDRNRYFRASDNILLLSSTLLLWKCLLKESILCQHRIRLQILQYNIYCIKIFPTSRRELP